MATDEIHGRAIVDAELRRLGTFRRGRPKTGYRPIGACDLHPDKPGGMTPAGDRWCPKCRSRESSSLTKPIRPEEGAA